MVILPVDQGVEHGPVQSFASNPPSYDPAYHFQLAGEAGLSAYAAPPGFLQARASDFAGSVPLILKINTSDSLYKSAEKPAPSIISSVEEALRLGCVGVGFTIYPGSEACRLTYEEVARACEKAKQYGLVVVIWSYPRGGGLSGKKGEQAVDVVSYAAHIAAQMGAHIIKVKPPTGFIEKPEARDFCSRARSLKDRVKLVLQAAFNGQRIVIFSGGPAQDKKLFLKEIRELALGGAFGSIVGRNVFKRPFKEALSLLKEVIHIYREPASEAKK